MRGFELKRSCQILSNFSNKVVTSKHEHHKELVSLKKKKKKSFRTISHFQKLTALASSDFPGKKKENNPCPAKQRNHVC